MKIDPKSDPLITYCMLSQHFEYYLYLHYHSGERIVFHLFRKQNCREFRVCINYMNENKYIIYTGPNELIANLKRKIEDKTRLAPHEQKLIFERKELEIHMPISYYNIKEESEILLILRL